MKIRRIAAAAVVAMACAGAANAQQFTAKMGIATLNDAQHAWAKNYAAALERDSGGRIKGDVYPASQLGTIPRMIEQTQFGSIQLWAGPPEFLYGVDQRFELLTTPFLFKDVDQANTVLQDRAFADKFLAIGEPKGLVGVGLFLSGPEAFVLRTPIHTLEGFAGLKLRVLASPMQLEPIRALKATPVPMSLGEVLPALQQGALDGVMGNGPVLTPLGYVDAAKYFIETDHSMVTSIAVISRKWYQSLPADLQKIVLDDGRKVSAELLPTTKKLIDDAFTTWKKGGGEVIYFTPPEQERLRKLLTPIGEQVVAAHPEERPIYELLKTTIKRVGE